MLLPLHSRNKYLMLLTSSIKNYQWQWLNEQAFDSLHFGSSTYQCTYVAWRYSIVELKMELRFLNEKKNTHKINPIDRNRERERDRKKINVFNYILSMWIMCLEASFGQKEW